MIDTDTITIAVGRAEPTRCRVADFGLTSATWAALRELVQGRGSVRRPDADAALLALGATLSRILSLEGAPFDFRDGVWTARFEASTL